MKANRRESTERPKVVAIIQARMGSTRLPGKVMQDLCGQPVLDRVVERTSLAKTLDEVVVATSDRPADGAIARLCTQRGWPCFVGSESDVLDRYYRAAQKHNAELVVRVTSDCPMVDPDVVDSHVKRMLGRWNRADIVTNMLTETYPLGLAVEALPFDTLERMHRLSDTPYLREHVTTLAYEKPEWFLIDEVLNDVDLSYHRWTVDTAADLEFIRHIFAHFGSYAFSWRDALDLLSNHPDWLEINRKPRQSVSNGVPIRAEDCE